MCIAAAIENLVVTPGLRAARARKGNDRFAQFFLSQRRNPHREETSSHPTAERGRGLRSRPGKASSSPIPSKNPWRGKRARAQTNPRQNDAAGGGRERQQPRKKKSHSGAGEESAAPNNAQQRHSERAGHNAVSEPTPVRREGKATRCSPCQRRVHTTRGSFARRRHTERSSEKRTTRWQGRRRRDILALRLLSWGRPHMLTQVMPVSPFAEKYGRGAAPASLNLTLLLRSSKVSKHCPVPLPSRSPRRMGIKGRHRIDREGNLGARRHEKMKSRSAAYRDLFAIPVARKGRNSELCISQKERL